MSWPNRPAQCASLAGPFKKVHSEDITGMLFILFSICSISFTTYIRRLVQGWSLFPPHFPADGPLARTEMGTQTDDIPSDDEPPPYHEPESSLLEVTRAANENVKPQIPPPTLKTLLLTTLIHILLLTTLVLQAFSVQCQKYCTDPPPSTPRPGYPDPNHPNSHAPTTVMANILWFLYAFVAMWASFGVTIWAMVVRDYFGGEGAEKRWPINQSFFFLCFLMVLIAPFIIVWFIGNEMWKWLRGKPIKPEEGRDVSLEEEGIRLVSESLVAGNNRAGEEARVTNDRGC